PRYRQYWIGTYAPQMATMHIWREYARRLPNKVFASQPIPSQPNSPPVYSLADRSESRQLGYEHPFPRPVLRSFFRWHTNPRELARQIVPKDLQRVPPNKVWISLLTCEGRDRSPARRFYLREVLPKRRLDPLQT